MITPGVARNLVAIYVRKSRLKDVDAMEIDRQIELCTDYADRNNMDYEVFSEEGSSEDWDGRPELQKMLMALKRNIYDGVLVTDQDRLTRDRTDFGLFVRFARAEGLRLFTLNKTYNFLNDDDVFTSGIQSEMDNHFMRMTKRKLRRGRIQALKKGVYFGLPPYGYTKDARKHLIPHPEESLIVKDIYDLYVHQGYNQVEVSEQLAMRGKFNRDGTPFKPRGIYWILQNVANKGILHYEMQGDEPIIVHDAHPALVTEEDFDLAQVKLLERRLVPQSQQRGIYVLSKLLVCPKCGQRLSFCLKYSSKQSARLLDKSKREVFILNCYSSKGLVAKQEWTASGKPRCNNNGVRADRVEEVVFYLLNQHLTDIDTEIQNVLEGKNEFISKVSSKQEELTLRFNHLEEQKKRIQEGYKIGLFDAEEAQAEMKLVKEEQLNIQNELKNLDGADIKGEVERQKRLKAKIEYLLSMEARENPTKTNKLLLEIIDKIYFWKEESDRDGRKKPFVLKIEYK